MPLDPGLDWIQPDWVQRSSRVRTKHSEAEYIISVQLNLVCSVRGRLKACWFIRCVAERPVPGEDLGEDLGGACTHDATLSTRKTKHSNAEHCI